MYIIREDALKNWERAFTITLMDIRENVFSMRKYLEIEGYI